MRVEPFELRAVKDGVRPAHSLEREFLHQLACAQKFLIASRRPSQQGQEIAQRFRQKALVAVGNHACRAVSLRKPRAVRAEDQRHVRKQRRLRPKRAVQQDLFRRVGKVVGAANHVRDAHLDVVHHGAELIRRQPGSLIAARGAQQDKVLDLFVCELSPPKNRVLKFGSPAERYLEADRGLCVLRGWLAVAASAADHAPHRPAARALFRRVAAGISVRRAEAKKRASIRQAFLRRFLIEHEPLRLVVRPFVPIDPQPAQAFEDAFHEFRPVPLRIGILDTQNHGPPLPSRKQPVEERRARSAHVKITRWRWSKPHARLTGCATQCAHNYRVSRYFVNRSV